jgi:hypothetical protein
MLEMFRRDQFNQQLVSERCGELLGLEARLEELDRLLDAITRRLPGRSAKCACGAPFVFGAHFCANCGRPVGAAVVSCEGCGGPLPAAARFCPACGRSAEPGEEQRPEPVETAGGGEREARDPWEE